MASQGESVWRNRDFSLLLGGTTVNGTGDWLLELALPVYVFTETGSGIKTALVYLFGLAVSVVFGPYGGSLADRWKLRATLVGTNVLQVFALAPLLAVTPDRIWPVYLVIVLQGLIGTVNDPAGFALLPRLVREDQLVAANSALSAGHSIARLVGAAVGGIAVATGGMTTVVVLDAATFVVGALAAALMGAAANQAPIESGSEDESDASVRAGLREVRSRPAVAALIGVRSLAMFAFGAFPVLFIVFVTEYLDGDGTEVGIIRAASAFGGIVAAAVIGRLAAKHHPADLTAAAYLLFTVVAFLFVNAPSVTIALGVYIVLFALTGFPNVASHVGTMSAAQTLCPGDVMGRVGGLMGAAGSLGMGLGSLAAGLLLEVFTARQLFNGQVVVFFLCGVLTAVLVARPVGRGVAGEELSSTG